MDKKNNSASNTQKPKPQLATTPKRNHSIAAGTVLKDRFLLTSLIAAGGTSDIYRARDLLAAALGERDAELAIKIPRLAEPGQARLNSAIALREATITRQLCHSNIIAVYEFHHDEGTSFVTMEYIHGETLATRLQRSPGHRLDDRELMRITRALTAALTATHAQGVIHADLKPGNILISDQGHITLIDFATARPCANTRSPTISESMHYSGHSPAYASQELLDDQPAHPADDIYSLACIFYEAFSGQHPYERLPATEAAQAGIKAKRPRRMRRGQWRALRKALSLDRQHRYAQIDEFMTALDRAERSSKKLMAATFAIATLAAIAWPASNWLHSHLDHVAALQEVQRHVAQTEQIIDSIRHAPPTERSLKLTTVDVLPELFRSAALQQLQLDLTGPLSQQIDHEIRMKTKARSTAELAELIDLLTDYYPDSANLQDATKQLQKRLQESAVQTAISPANISQSSVKQNNN